MNYKLKRLVENTDIGAAMRHVKQGGRNVAFIESWNGAGMFVYYVKPDSYPARTDVAKAAWGGEDVQYRAYLALKTADGSVATWAPSGSDALSENWVLAKLVAEGEVEAESVAPAKPEMAYYVGRKIVQLAPMTRGEYNAYRGWKMPANEKADDAGYLVEYELSPNDTANHPNHAGYISWSPKEVADEAYSLVRDTALVNDERVASIANIPPHVKRMLVEEALLATDLGKLVAFLKRPDAVNIAGEEALKDMSLQRTCMAHYHGVLGARIFTALAPLNEKVALERGQTQHILHVDELSVFGNTTMMNRFNKTE